MLSCNLAVLLAERNLKISKVAADTGISRTTLTSLVNNYSQGIQFDTLNTLCIYLRVHPKDILVHFPYDFEFYYIDVENKYYIEGENKYYFDIGFRIQGKSKKYTGAFDCAISLYSFDKTHVSIFLSLQISEEIEFSEIQSIFQKFTAVEWQSVERSITPLIKDNFFKNYYPDIDIENLEIDYDIDEEVFWETF